MLRCKSSQIHLTSADINDLEERLAARRSSHPSTGKGKARLSTAPRLPTIIAARREDFGTTAQHASTSMPLPPFHGREATQVHRPHASSSRDTSSFNAQPDLQWNDRLMYAREFEPVKVDFTHANPASTSRLALPGLHPSDSRLRHRRRQTSPSHHAITPFDGAVDCGHGIHPRSHLPAANTGPFHAGREVFRQLPGGDAAARPAPGLARPNSSARARRSRIRNGDRAVQLHGGLPLLPPPTSPQASRDQRPDTTAIPRVLVSDDRDVEVYRSLDPGAPLFTPRVRFGSTTVLSTSEQEEPSDQSPGYCGVSNLRLRTPSEQNATPRSDRHSQSRADDFRSHSRTDAETPDVRPRRLRSNALVARSRRSSENDTLPLPRPNLERYPLLLPTTTPAVTGRNAFDGERRDSFQSSDTQNTALQRDHHQSLSPSDSPIDFSLLHPASSSPTPSSALPGAAPTRSPRLPSVVHSRKISTSWCENSPQPSESSRIPSIVSAASGISSRSISEKDTSPQKRSTTSPDAAAEFLKCRSSPLDGFTAEMSRLSTAVGPQEQPRVAARAQSGGRKRVRLLSGNLFYDDVESRRHQGNDDDESLEIPPISSLQSGDIDASSPKLIASPSHMTMTGNPLLPKTPRSQHSISPNQRDSLADLPTARPSKVAFDTTTPNPKTPSITTATPRVPVYNDYTPAHIQPQTPADIQRSTRRSRNRSDSSVHREAFCVGQFLVAPRPAIPQRRHFRNTYPSNNPGGAVANGHVGALLQRVESGGIDGGSDSSGGALENETAGQLAEMERERGVWMARRRQGGSLDVTPPGEGRFERFLE